MKTSDELKAQAINLKELVAFSVGSVVSKTLVDKKAGSLTLFAFDKGQGLSEHTSPYDAVVEILDGVAELTIGGKQAVVSEGQIVIMPANIPHAVRATHRFKMLLIMIREKD